MDTHDDDNCLAVFRRPEGRLLVHEIWSLPLVTAEGALNLCTVGTFLSDLPRP